uniref:AlNc14C289G10215 protein n=1 Tax=Albugo laibachii Nc14 TaxID=890382 RepID=F0WV70_9STRA|nr:AlNc14C289G10215 [Albugo laibachii Nc14]|eukprot:CCA25309.1 AlNc14C289G10215 [Albugo laibachii Nc14]
MEPRANIHQETIHNAKIGFEKFRSKIKNATKLTKGCTFGRFSIQDIRYSYY